MDDILYWIWLSCACGAGCSYSDRLLSYCGNSPKALYDASPAELEPLLGELGAKPDALLLKDLDEARRIKSYCAQHNIGLLPADSEYYPERLRKIKDKPILLYYKGSLPDLDRRVCIAMVGTRRMTEYGKRSAYTIAYDLARSGAVVVSGMALGVDGMCHRAALDAGGHTIAILGCGIDRVYPKAHEELMDEIMLRGTVMSEYKPATPPNGFHFPIRNRIISGISQGTIVIEADLKSGAMITARCALYQGRDIYALPGKAGEQNSEGTNRLIKDGAKMATSALDILSDYVGLYPRSIKLDKITKYTSRQSIAFSAAMNAGTAAPPKRKQSKTQQKKSARDTSDPAVELPARPPGDNKSPAASSEPKPAFGSADNLPPLTPSEAAVLEIFPDSEPVSADKLSGSGIPIGEILAALTMLEIKGRVEARPGGLYIKLG